MFTSARIKLTAWYLVIIMTISVLFSSVIFVLLSHEIQGNYLRFFQRNHVQSEFDFELAPPPLPLTDQTILNASTERLKESLVLLNILIFVVSATAGYWLAGRTLKPISEMVDDQNRFVADASHELRTPLTALRTTIEVNLRDKKLDLAGAKEILASNLQDVGDLQTLSDSLLLLAGTGNSHNELIIEEILLPKLVKTATSKLKVLATSKGVMIIEKVSNVTLRGDNEKLTRLLIILIENAIKYSPNNGTVEILTKKTSTGISVEVRDNGVGIGENDLPHIFDRFYRADKSRSQIPGHGLGLAIAKKIVELHHGALTVKSLPNEGSTFTVLLPLAPSHSHRN